YIDVVSSCSLLPIHPFTLPLHDALPIFGISFDWCRRDTENMIVPQEGVPATYGAAAPQSNFGSLRTKGIEIMVDYAKSFSNGLRDRKSTRLNSSHVKISYAVFCSNRKNT